MTQFKMRFALTTAAMALFAATAMAEDGLTREEIRRVDAPGSMTHEVVVSRLEVQPGATIPRHTHAGDEHMVVLQGGNMLAPNGKTIPFALGNTAHFPAGQIHGGLKNMGDAPLIALTTHIIEKGKPFMTLAE